MKYVELDTHSGVMMFDIKDNTAILSGYRGRDVSLSIPGSISHQNETYAVSSIGAKAFLSNRNLSRIDLPETVDIIGNWAFAGCRNLTEIHMNRGTALENGVFKDCLNLQRVFIDESETTAALLAATVNLLEDRFLFDPSAAGGAEWVENWDRRMERTLDEPDEEGFIALLACGEEDYEGKDNTLEAYLSRRRMRKVSICFTRLMNDDGLTEVRRKRLENYLYNHRAGTLGYMSESDNSHMDDNHTGRMCLNIDKYGSAEPPSEGFSEGANLVAQDESWKYVLEKHGDEQEYYDVLLSCGCITDENISLMLADLGDRHTRMKAYLMQNTAKKENTFFDEYEL